MQGKLHPLLPARLSLLLLLCIFRELRATEETEDLSEHGANLLEVFLLGAVLLRSLTILLVLLEVCEYLS